MSVDLNEKLRKLPAVGELLEEAERRGWLKHHPRSVVARALREVLHDVRGAILHAEGDQGGEVPSYDTLLAWAQRHMQEMGRASLRPVINATGIVLHTGLGRAPLAPDAIEAVVQCAMGYSNLELELAEGTRGKRQDHVAALLCELTGAEAATVVNNNAAATLLVLNAVATGREVVVSRGQLVEIGGSYRLPDVMSASGAILREVGTTNRTRVLDYANAYGEATAAFMHVHTSNYRIVGFSESVQIEELVALGHERGLAVIDDLGSGAFIDLAQYGLPAEPDLRRSVRAGADLICCSGDKLLGGPQAGIILGKKEWIQKIEKNPLMRTYRVDKMTLAALEATLRLYRDEAMAMKGIPALMMLTEDDAVLKERAERFAAALQVVIAGAGKSEAEVDLAVERAEGFAGGGSLPAAALQSWVVAWRPRGFAADAAARALRTGDPAVVARVQDGRVLFDVRTIEPGQLDALCRAAVFAVKHA